MNSDKNTYIFLCSNSTEDDCFNKMLFGGGISYRSKVKHVQIGDNLILYNYDSKTFYGFFEAISESAMNIDTEAWSGQYPWQVKVKWLKKYNPITKIDFELITKFPKFPPQSLNKEQTVTLENIFSSEERLPAEEPNFRNDFPANKLTIDGHFVRSLGEVAIDNWLFTQEIAHGYERKLPIKEVMYCDFFIPISNSKDYLYVEYWGREDDKYLKRKQEKQQLYEKYKFKLIELTPRDIDILDDILPDKLRNFLPNKKFY